jgi:hypothetical protein
MYTLPIKIPGPHDGKNSVLGRERLLFGEIQRCHGLLSEDT